MAKLVSVFISRRHRRLMGLAVWIFSFVGVLLILGWFAVQRADDHMRAELQEGSAQFVRVRENVASTFAAMRLGLNALPCSPAFIEQLRDIAYRPDGLNEFMYAPDGKVRCSIDRQFKTPVDLGPPDIATASGEGASLWLDRDLSFLGRRNLVGTVALIGPFATVVPPQNLPAWRKTWLDMEVGIATHDGGWWHRAGSRGVHERSAQATAQGFQGRGLRYARVCDPEGFTCVVGELDLVAHASEFPAAAGAGLVLATLVASFATRHTNRLMERYWSFEARFCRHLDAESIICAYQPVMDLDSGQIIGCEILARWRDIDDRIVFPDRFVAIVERHALTLRFTELVVRRAYEELSRNVPADRKLQVNFNIYPRDLDSVKLTGIFADFTARPDRFEVVLEIIESNEFPATAQQEIERLRQAGIKTYIDDFGTGYSNMQNIATLEVDGVKLDRSFAMAPDDSLMARMLGHAVEMIEATGRVMVVEGIETAERLRLLRDMAARIDHVQGYFISRPLDVTAFAEFLASGSFSFATRSDKEAA